MLNLTEAAKTRIDEICKKNDSYALSLNISGGGCSGPKFDWDLIKSKDDMDEDDYECLETGNGGILAIGIFCLANIIGSTVDFKHDTFGSQFVIDNPQASSSKSGGCGSCKG